MTRYVLALTGIALAVLLAPANAHAQSPAPWGPPEADRVVTLDVVRPSFDGLDLSFPSPMLYGGVRWPLSPTVGIAAEVPLALFATQGSSATLLGNPYLGIDYAAAGPRGLVARLGGRPPIATESGDFGGVAQVIAGLADYDRFQAWIEDLWSAAGHLGWRARPERGLGGGFTIGATLLSPKGADKEVLGDYRADVEYRDQRFAVGAELTGRAILSEQGLGVGDRTIHQLTVGVGVALGPVWPRAFLRIPVDADLKDAGFNTAFGVGVSWVF
jgi:hypothetical protein